MTYDINYSKKVIEIKLREGYEVYFKNEYLADNPKEIKRMLSDLMDKGIDLSLDSGWFD